MILVINLGLKSIRAIIFDQNGRKLATASRPVNTLLDGHRVEQDPEDWWRLAAEVTEEASVDRALSKYLQAVTVTASSSCLVSIGGDGQVLGPAIMVSDGRDAVEKRQLAAAGFEPRSFPMISRMMWLKTHKPDVFRQIRQFASVNGFLISRLTGRMATDPLDGEKSGWQSSEGKWHQPLLDLVGVDTGQMPEILPCGADLGPLTPAAKRHLKLEAAPQMHCYLSTYDAICAVFGSGVNKDGEACDISGTVTSLRAVSSRRPLEGPADIFTQYESTSGLHIIGGSNNLGGGVIEWARQTFYEHERYPYEVMTHEAESCPPGAEGLVFLPYLLGERAPLWDADLRGVFFGLERHHSRRHLIRSVFEGTALGLVPLKAAIEARVGRIHRIHASGGLSRLALINQIKADIMQTEILLPAEFESTAFGAFCICSVALGSIPSLAEAQALVQIRSIVVPDTRHAAMYGDLVSFYKALLDRVRPLLRMRREQLLPQLQLDVSVVGNL